MELKLATLDQNERRQLVDQIQEFFYEERDEEIGIIAAEEVLEFFLNNLGALFYNKGLDDARSFFNRKMGDLDIDYDMLYQGEEGVYRK